MQPLTRPKRGADQRSRQVRNEYAVGACREVVQSGEGDVVEFSDVDCDLLIRRPCQYEVGLVRQRRERGTHLRPALSEVLPDQSDWIADPPDVANQLQGH